MHAVALVRTIALLGLMGLPGVLGCGDRGPALTPLRGRLLFNEEPLAGAELVFHPQFDGPGWLPVAVTGEDGTFDAGTKQPGDGVVPGRYKVTATWRPSPDGESEGPNRLPERYSRVETTDVEVQAGPESDAPLTLRVVGPPRGKKR